MPKLYNAIVRTLPDILPGIDSDLMIHLGHGFVIDLDYVQDCWNRADFSKDAEQHCALTVGDVYWGNKKRLLYVLDTIALDGAGRVTASEILRKGGDLAVVFGSSGESSAARQIPLGSSSH